jgi:hypothetical protein
MLYWGEEFYDDGNFGKLYNDEPNSYKPGGLLVPIDLLDEIVDTKYIKEISLKDKSKVDWLRSQFSTVGQLHPGTIVYDRNYIRLKDGNHRYLAAKQLEWTHMRVLLRRVDGNATNGVPIAQILQRFIEIAYEG